MQPVIHSVSQYLMNYCVVNYSVSRTLVSALIGAVVELNIPPQTFGLSRCLVRAGDTANRIIPFSHRHRLINIGEATGLSTSGSGQCW